MPNRRNAFIIFFFVTLLVTGVLSYHEIGCDDHWWHVATGRLIRAEMRVPDVDVFSFTYAGSSWHNHEWGFSLFISLVWDYAGPVGFFLYRWLVLFGIVAFLWGAVREHRVRAGASPPSLSFSFSLLFFILLVIQIRIAIRPHLLGYLFLSGLVWRLQRPLVWKDRWLLLGQSLLFFAAWSFFHYSWVLGVVAVVTTIGDRYLRWKWGDGIRFLKDMLRLARQYRWRVIAISSSLLILMTLLLFYGPLSFVLSHFFVLDNNEWKSYLYWLSLHPFFAVTIPYYLLLILFSLRIIRTEPFYGFLVFIVAILPFRSSRFMTEFLIISLPIMIHYLSEFLFDRDLRLLRRIPVVMLNAILAVALAESTVLMYRDWGVGVSTTKNPVWLADFMEEKGLAGNLYATNLSFHAYFMFRSWPEIKVFFDGRDMQVYPVYFIKDYLSLSFSEIVTKYPVDYIVKDIAISGLDRHDAEFLAAAPSPYELVYFDQHWALFMKEEVIARYPAIRSFRMLYPINLASERLMRQVVERGNLPILRGELAHYLTLVRQPEQQQLYDLMRAEIAKYGPVD